MTNLTRVKGMFAISFNKALESLSHFDSLQQVGSFVTLTGPLLKRPPGLRESGDQGQSEAQGAANDGH